MDTHSKGNSFAQIGMAVRLQCEWASLRFSPVDSSNDACFFQMMRVFLHVEIWTTCFWNYADSAQIPDHLPRSLAVPTD